MHQDDPITPGSNTRPTSPENNRTSSDIDSLNDGEEGISEEALASLLNSPEVHHLSAEFAALIQVMLKAPTTTTTAKGLLNATARFLTTHFADKPKWTMPRTRDPSLGAGRQNYVIHQHLFHKDRARLLDLISGKSREWHQSANPKEIAHLLAQRISKHSLPDTEPFSPKPQRPAPHGLELISEAEILATDFRPISISSSVYRIFSTIISNRLAEYISLNQRQKGFVQGTDGCNANLRNLQACICDARRNGKPLAVAFLDVAKAFDSVSHYSILRALERHRINRVLRDLIGNMLKGGSTIAQLGTWRSAPIKINCSIKQGDPISPSCYHLSTHRPTTPTPELEQSGLTAVAFAVDVAVLGKSVVALNQQLQLCTNFFRSRHLRLNASKCVALSLAPAPKRKTASADVTHSRILLQTGRETYSLLVISPEETEGSTSVPYTPLLQATDVVSQMPRHLISDAHEWINKIPTVAIYCLAKPQPRERAWQNQRGKKTLLSLTLV
ncbi:hypothetical protein M514_27827 [Trichuris suis]|uniref:Reverse transcriptase domain-containing protein n=1 Tax=Trichuris suis TaxID=68888 RepID=A0A085MRY3_9BILA|nr:hypothetical protein M514_27827 [Trichuris suis]